jgi:hypothetical protein
MIPLQTNIIYAKYQDDSELGQIWKKMAMTYVKVLSQHLCRGKPRNPHSRQPVSEIKSKPADLLTVRQEC